MRAVFLVLDQDPIGAAGLERVEVGEGFLDDLLDSRARRVAGEGREVNDPDESPTVSKNVAESHRAERTLSRFM
jgi:hypothetical protein